MAEPVSITRHVAVVEGCRPDAIPADVLQSQQPLLLKGLVQNWPAVQAGLTSQQAMCDYIAQFYQQQPLGLFFGQPEIQGRFFYNEDMSGFNFEKVAASLTTVLDRILAVADHSNAPSIFVGGTKIDECLPEFRRHNTMPAVPDEATLIGLWIGNRSVVATHNDLPDNLACCVAGKRRFTLFPPSQIDNLYIGPLDFTPSGQAVSLVNLQQPDLQKHPKFSQALIHAQVAELEAGDALFIPSLWWHQVEALASLNILVNYWWRKSPAYMGPPLNVLRHAMLSMRDLSANEKAMWKHMFDYYIFAHDEHTHGHIPAAVQGCLAEMTEDNARQLRAMLLAQLNR